MNKVPILYLVLFGLLVIIVSLLISYNYYFFVPSGLVWAEGSDDNGLAISKNTFGMKWNYVRGTGDNSATHFDIRGQFIYTVEHCKLFRFNSDGSNKVDITPHPSLYNCKFALAPSGPSGEILASSENQVYVEFMTHTGSGVTWCQVNIPSLINPITALTIAGNLGTIMWATDGQKIWKSIDRGGSWDELSNGIDWLGNIKAISVDPQDPNAVYLATDSGRVWQSNITAFGIKWIDITGDLSKLSLNSIVVYRNSLSPISSAPLIFVGANPGVYVSLPQAPRNSGQTHWMIYGSGLPEVEVTDLDITSGIIPGSDVIAAGTNGRGVFFANLWQPGIG